MDPTVGIIHPGAMGAAIAAALTAADRAAAVLWAGDGRSEDTRRRATGAGLTDVDSVAALVERSDVLLSVCPPEAAGTVAATVAELGFGGLYVDANAVSPDTARSIAAGFDRFVDGGIVGPPPTGPGLTRLYAAGEEAAAVADLFAGSDVEVRVVGGPPGAASAVKMCYASWTKGTSALLLAIRALAEAEGVSEDLLAEWATSLPELVARSEGTAGAVGPKAWRFEAEMHEISDTFASADLPDGFHRAAAEIYQRLAPLKGTTNPTLGEAMDRILKEN